MENIFQEHNYKIQTGEDDLIQQVGEFPLAAKVGFEDYVNTASSSMGIVRNFSKQAATDMNGFFTNYFFSFFNKEVKSLDDLWRGFTVSMKNHFLKSISEMASQWAMSGLRDIGSSLIKGLSNFSLSSILPFSKGGIIPKGEDGLFAGLEGEAVLTRNAVGILGKNTIGALNSGGALSATPAELMAGDLNPFNYSDLGGHVIDPGVTGTYIDPSVQPGFFDGLGDSLSEALKGFKDWVSETFPGLSTPGASLAGLAGGIAGGLLSNELFTSGFESSIGGSLGGLAGTLIAANPALLSLGPWGIAAGAFLGTVAGSGIGSIFGGPKLHEGEQRFGALFKQLDANPRFTGDRFADFAKNLAIARLQEPNAGADSISDALRGMTDRVINGSDVDPTTIDGFRQLIADGIMTREDIENRLIKDLVIFKGSFASGLDFVPFDDFPAMLHRGERVLTESENRRFFSLPDPVEIFANGFAQMRSQSERELRVLEDINRALETSNTLLEQAQINIKVVTPDEERLVEKAIRAFQSRLKTREILIDVTNIDGLARTARA